MSSPLSAVALFPLKPGAVMGPEADAALRELMISMCLLRWGGWCMTRGLCLVLECIQKSQCMLSSTGNLETICCFTLIQQFCFFSGRRAIGRPDWWSPCPFQITGIKKIPWFSSGVSGGVLSYRPDCLLELICTAWQGWETDCNFEMVCMVWCSFHSNEGWLLLHVKAEGLSNLMNLYEATVETIIFHFPVFLNDALTPSAENAELSLRLFMLQRGTSSVWLAEFEGPPEHSWAVPQIHKPFLL